jgi:hypothetical protein
MRPETNDLTAGPIVALYVAGETVMATLSRATRLFAAVAALGLAATAIALAQQPVSITTTVSGPSQSRPNFTRPGGIPGSARSIAASNQYLLAPAQPTDPVTLKKRKLH